MDKQIISNKLNEIVVVVMLEKQIYMINKKTG